VEGEKGKGESKKKGLRRGCYKVMCSPRDMALAGVGMCMSIAGLFLCCHLGP
jgi:hypothetical protein